MVEMTSLTFRFCCSRDAIPRYVSLRRREAVRQALTYTPGRGRGDASILYKSYSINMTMKLQLAFYWSIFLFTFVRSPEYVFVVIKLSLFFPL